MHVRSALPSGGRPHAILRSRQNVQARLGRRGSFTLRDDFGLEGTGTAVVSTTVWSDGTGSGILRPIEVNGGPLSPKAYGFFLMSSDGVVQVLVGASSFAI